MHLPAASGGLLRSCGFFHLEGTRLAPLLLHPPVASCGFSGLMRLIALQFRSYCMYPRLLAPYCGFLHLIAASCIFLRLLASSCGFLRLLAASCASRTPNERRSCGIVLRPYASSCTLLHLVASYCINRTQSHLADVVAPYRSFRRRRRRGPLSR